MGTVVDRKELSRALDKLRARGKTIVSTNGCFDILHVGHVRYLKAARQLGDVLVIGLNSDASVKRLKGAQRPIVAEADRAEILSSLACVDFVSIFDEDTPVELLKVIKPQVHVKGGDYNPCDLAETPVVESLGGRLAIIDLVPGKSTTGLVSRLQSKDPSGPSK